MTPCTVRSAELAPRASLLARDGTPLAEGPSRSSPIPGVAAGIVGVLGPIPADEAASYSALGYPERTYPPAHDSEPLPEIA